MVGKHKGQLATFSLGRKFIPCWMIYILIPPCKHPQWTLGSMAQLWGASYTCRYYRPCPMRAAQLHSTIACGGKIKSGTERQPLCHKESCCSPLHKLRSWLVGGPWNECFLWLFPVKTPAPCVRKRQEQIHLFVTFQTLRLIFPLITLKNRGYLYTLRSITVSPVTNHPPSALSMMWKIVAI